MKGEEREDSVKFDDKIGWKDLAIQEDYIMTLYFVKYLLR